MHTCTYRYIYLHLQTHKYMHTRDMAITVYRYRDIDEDTRPGQGNSDMICNREALADCC